jgi:serine protease Do
MKKLTGSLNKPFLCLILLSLIALTLSCTLAAAQTAEPSLTLSPPGSLTVVPSPSPSPGEASPIPPMSTPIITGSPILPEWDAPALSLDELPADLSDIAARVLPSVVSINVNLTTTDITGQPTIQQGAGSGWVIDPDGLIVTNTHVIQSAQTITVSFSDGRTYPVQQVAADRITDIAVIKIDATGLPAVTVGDSSKLREGMMVIAIGNALGQGLSVTAGWTSRKGVSLTVPGNNGAPNITLFDLIEITAPINPGNSGGPLINMLGEVVGITNAKLIATGVEAVGYAISSRSAIPVIQQLIREGEIIHPYMGVLIQDVDPSIASVFNLAVDEGAMITEIVPGGPADQAGLQPNDVIIRIDDTEITSAAEAVEAILSSEIGQEVTITFYRGAVQSTVQVTLTENPNR